MLSFQGNITWLFWSFGVAVALIFVLATSLKEVYAVYIQHDTTSSIFLQRCELFWDFMTCYGGYMGM